MDDRLGEVLPTQSVLLVQVRVVLATWCEPIACVLPERCSRTVRNGTVEHILPVHGGVPPLGHRVRFNGLGAGTAVPPGFPQSPHHRRPAATQSVAIQGDLSACLFYRGVSCICLLENGPNSARGASPSWSMATFWNASAAARTWSRGSCGVAGRESSVCRRKLQLFTQRETHIDSYCDDSGWVLASLSPPVVLMARSALAYASHTAFFVSAISCSL